MPNRTCAHCGIETSRPKFCSDRCKDADKYERYKSNGRYEASKRAKRARYASDPEYRERMLARHQTVPEVELHCGECGEVFSGHDHRRFCSTDCRIESEARRNRARKRRQRARPEPRIDALNARVDSSILRVVVEFQDTGGFFAWCPLCKSFAGRFEDCAWHERRCTDCSAFIVLNEEECRWLASPSEAMETAA